MSKLEKLLGYREDLKSINNININMWSLLYPAPEPPNKGKPVPVLTHIVLYPRTYILYAHTCYCFYVKIDI